MIGKFFLRLAAYFPQSPGNIPEKSPSDQVQSNYDREDGADERDMNSAAVPAASVRVAGDEGSRGYTKGEILR